MSAVGRGREERSIVFSAVLDIDDVGLLFHHNRILFPAASTCWILKFWYRLIDFFLGSRTGLADGAAAKRRRDRGISLDTPFSDSFEMMKDGRCCYVAHGIGHLVPWDPDPVVAADGLYGQEKEFIAAVCMGKLSQYISRRESREDESDDVLQREKKRGQMSRSYTIPAGIGLLPGGIQLLLLEMLFLDLDKLQVHVFYCAESDGMGIWILDAAEGRPCDRK